MTANMFRVVLTALVASVLIDMSVMCDDQLLQTMAATEERMKLMERRATGMINRVQDSLDDLETKLGGYEKRLEGLRAVESNHQQTRSLSYELTDSKSLGEKLVDVECRVRKLEESIANITQHPGGRGAAVGFLANHVEDIDAKEHEPIVFENVLFNLGEGYNCHTGKFTAPVRGIYTFSAFLCTETGLYLYYSIVKNYDLLLMGSLREDDYRQCTSVTVTVDMEKGDQVWIDPTHDGSDYEIKRDYLRLNAFSGALIQETA